MAITRDPSSSLNKLIGEKRFEYPSGIALKGLHHFMLIKELKWKSPEKNSDAFNGAQSGQSNFENIVLSDDLVKYSLSEMTVSYNDINGLNTNFFRPIIANIFAKYISKWPMYPTMIMSCLGMNNIY